MYIPWVVMFLGFINTNISSNHKSHSLSELPVLFYQTLRFFREKCTLSHFWENKQNPNPHFLCKVGEIQLIKATCFTYLLLQRKPVIIEIFNNRNLRMCHLLNFQKILLIRQKKQDRQEGFFFSFLIIIIFFHAKSIWKTESKSRQI